VDDPAFLPQPSDWKYKVAFEFPLRDEDGQEFLDAIMKMGSWINAALVNSNSAVYEGRAYFGDAVRFYVLTDAPERTVKRLHRVIEQHAPRPDYSAGCRKLKTREWSVLWPKDLDRFVER
jgi:hypothetical protein